MNEIYIIMPDKISNQLDAMVKAASEGTRPIIINSPENIPDLKNKKILFALELNNAGLQPVVFEILSRLCERGFDSLSGSTGCILTRSSNELYTKSASQYTVFIANQLGCSFPGHPLVEATGSFENFRTWQKQMDIPLEDICIEMCKKLGARFINEKPSTVQTPKILVLHSSMRKTSNTLELWHMVSNHLSSCSLTELHVENGEVLDCKGCSYKTCIHYSKQNSCFYGGIMVKDILPAIEKSDAVVWICPNYNDAVSANLSAVINRLTALYRKINFYNKSLFSVIVSGNSGSDTVARQLIGALNINKGFRLPQHFALTEIANDTGEIRKVPGIEEKAANFAQNIIRNIKT